MISFPKVNVINHGYTILAHDSEGDTSGYGFTDWWFSYALEDIHPHCLGFFAVGMNSDEFSQ